MDQVRMLIVEDDQWLRDLYSDIFKKEGYQVEVAEDGLKGFAKLKQGGWTIALLDIILPGMNGLEIVKQIKSIGANAAHVILFMTNLYEDAQSREAVTLGNGYLVKSQYTPDAFVQEVKKHLAAIPVDATS